MLLTALRRCTTRRYCAQITQPPKGKRHIPSACSTVEHRDVCLLELFDILVPRASPAPFPRRPSTTSPDRTAGYSRCGGGCCCGRASVGVPLAWGLLWPSFSYSCPTNMTRVRLTCRVPRRVNTKLRVVRARGEATGWKQSSTSHSVVACSASNLAGSPPASIIGMDGSPDLHATTYWYTHAGVWLRRISRGVTAVVGGTQ